MTCIPLGVYASWGVYPYYRTTGQCIPVTPHHHGVLMRRIGAPRPTAPLALERKRYAPSSRCSRLRRRPRAARGALLRLVAPRPPRAVTVLALQPGTASAWLRAAPALPSAPGGGARKAKTPARPGGITV
jgi:hypothetical protein